MPTTITQADSEVHEMACELIRADWHKDIRLGPGDEDGKDYVRMCILMAHNADEKPIRVAGVPVSAKVSVIPYKQRVDKRADVEFFIDADHWDNATEPQQRALLDRCITYIDIDKDELGSVKTDDAGRPKLALKICDWNLSGFKAIAERYGADAPEVAEARAFEEKFGTSVLHENRPGLFAGSRS